MLEKIIAGIFKAVFHLLGFVVQTVWQIITGAVAKKQRDVYPPPPSTQTTVNLSGIAPPPLPPELPTRPKVDERFAVIDAAVVAGLFEDALGALAGPPPLGGATPDWRFNAAHRCWLLWQRWNSDRPRPDQHAFENIEEWIDACQKRDDPLLKLLQAGCVHVELLLGAQPEYPGARMLARELHSQAAQRAKGAEGYSHQKRVLELTDGLIEYDAFDLASRCADWGNVFGNFFDDAESLFKAGRISPDNHFTAAMAYEGSIHSEQWPLSAKDRERGDEFLKAALAHLEYCVRYKLETGPHWHNVMARVMAGLGKLDDARFHFQRFKDMMSKEPHGEDKIATFGRITVRVINHYVDQHNASIQEYRG